MNTSEFVAGLDLNLRHKTAEMTPQKFISEYCKVFREYAYATQDEGINEFEKQITYVLGMLIYYQRFCEIVGFFEIEDFDPRDYVDEFEGKKKQKRLNRVIKFLDEVRSQND